MWSKAEELLGIENAVTLAPGFKDKDRMLLLYSKETLHYVRYKKTSQYLCDDGCPQWCSSKICSHVLAVAQVKANSDLDQFLCWFVQHEGSNLSVLVMSGLPPGRG